MLTDSFGREVTGVRVSLTDRCNFDCVYCHNEGLGDTRGPMAAQDHEMGADDVVRILEVLTEFDVDSVKFTGGEPLLREDLESIVARAPEELSLSMTTNGTFLPGRATALAEAGLERVNISQDALDREVFTKVTGSGAYDAVMDGVDAALDAGLGPVKLNVVVFDETAPYVPEMVDYVARNPGLRLQLIEYMPELTGNPEWGIDIQRVHEWLADRAVEHTQREMHDRARYWVAPEAADDPSPSERDPEASDTDPDEQLGMVEIVDPVENPTFCANCHRVRVTHDGRFTGCLNRTDDFCSMGELTKSEIRAAYRDVVANRVPFYGEYMIETESGEWEINDAYVESPPGSP
ncbi:putative molybdenum cofactor biosynthesis protein A, archaeal [Halovivax ruber XH-70]|uniref:GTP 3',8-cyclase n=1 Tax=Halovivax ruber (strain DSM 18193 / JCM 13892 / XH-70) TaxID=797302 RepID=L0IEI4_HALRX|nr:GTP 3',8-cyclase MoaA [Halovivax ruber]AGB16357.1 putative molybdenum cofactor biosynthesis protein A, archaeal [Halovivax ruber XH-70]